MSETPKSPEVPKPKRLIAEVGAGRHDGSAFNIWEPAIARRRLQSGDAYLGIDRGGDTEEKRQKMRQWWGEMRAQHTGEEGQIAFTEARGERLPLPDDSADEVLFFNLYGHGATGSDFATLMGEAARVLKPNGTIVVQDDHTPIYGENPPIPEGFEITEKMWSLAQFAPRYNELAQQYGFRTTDTGYNTGMVFVIKPTSEAS